jgi:hypothetical protein
VELPHSTVAWNEQSTVLLTLGSPHMCTITPSTAAMSFTCSSSALVSSRPSTSHVPSACTATARVLFCTGQAEWLPVGSVRRPHSWKYTVTAASSPVRALAVYVPLGCTSACIEGAAGVEGDEA